MYMEFEKGSDKKERKESALYYIGVHWQCGGRSNVRVVVALLTVYGGRVKCLYLPLQCIGMSWVLTTNPLEQSFSQSLWNIYINNIVIFGWGWLINIVMSIPQKHCVLSRAVVKRQFIRKLGRKGEWRTKLSNKEALKALQRGNRSAVATAAAAWWERERPCKSNAGFLI